MKFIIASYTGRGKVLSASSSSGCALVANLATTPRSRHQPSTASTVSPVYCFRRRGQQGAAGGACPAGMVRPEGVRQHERGGLTTKYITRGVMPVPATDACPPRARYTAREPEAAPHASVISWCGSHSASSIVCPPKPTHTLLLPPTDLAADSHTRTLWNLRIWRKWLILCRVGR